MFNFRETGIGNCKIFRCAGAWATGAGFWDGAAGAYGTLDDEGDVADGPGVVAGVVPQAMQDDGVAEAAQVDGVEAQRQRPGELLRGEVEEGIETTFAEIERVQELIGAIEQVGGAEGAIAGKQHTVEDAGALGQRAE